MNALSSISTNTLAQESFRRIWLPDQASTFAPKQDFLFMAIETSLWLGAWDDVDRHCAALADYTAREPLPLVDFLIARGRALASWGRGRFGPEAIEELRRLRGEAARRVHMEPYAHEVPPDWEKEGYGSIFASQRKETIAKAS